jgi:hypothetical protein
VQAGRIWCEADSVVVIQSPTPSIIASLIEPGGSPLHLNRGTSRTKAAGWYSLQVDSLSRRPVPFEVTVTYNSTQGLEKGN